MKTIISICAFLLMSVLSFAQTEKGTVSIGLELNSIERGRGLNWNFNTEYFIKDSWSIGGGIGNFQYWKSENNKLLSFEAYINTHKYFRNDKKWQPFVGARLTYKTLAFEQSNAENQSFNSLSFGLDAGVQYNVNKKLSVMLGIRPSYYIGLNDNKSKTAFKVPLSLGVKYNFQMKKSKKNKLKSRF